MIYFLVMLYSCAVVLGFVWGYITSHEEIV